MRRKPPSVFKVETSKMYHCFLKAFLGLGLLYSIWVQPSALLEAGCCKFARSQDRGFCRVIGIRGSFVGSMGYGSRNSYVIQSSTITNFHHQGGRKRFGQDAQDPRLSGVILLSSSSPSRPIPASTVYMADICCNRVRGLGRLLVVLTRHYIAL